VCVAGVLGPGAQAERIKVRQSPGDRAGCPHVNVPCRVPARLWRQPRPQREGAQVRQVPARHLLSRRQRGALLALQGQRLPDHAAGRRKHRAVRLPPRVRALGAGLQQVAACLSGVQSRSIVAHRHFPPPLPAPLPNPPPRPTPTTPSGMARRWTRPTRVSRAPRAPFQTRWPRPRRRSRWAPWCASRPARATARARAAATRATPRGRRALHAARAAARSARAT
jgi:hypothetical protein